MILRQTFINKIRSLTYKPDTETKRVHIWRKKGGDHFITVHKRDELEDVFVANSLRQAGLSEDQIRDFIAQHAVSGG